MSADYATLDPKCRQESTSIETTKSILNTSFHYTPSTHTDLKKTFAKVRREQRAHDKAAASDAQARANVLPIHQGKVDAAT
jgi:hypothetical protein